MEKVIIYQIFTRLFGNRQTTRKEYGTIAENGCGKMGDFTPEELRALLELATPVSFGPTILRAETAAIFGLSVLAAAGHASFRRVR